MNKRSPYDQGWLDGAEHTAKTYDGWNERDKTLNAAVDKLKAALDQSERVRALEAALKSCRTALEAANYWDYYEGRDEFPRDQISDALKRLDALERAPRSGNQIAPDTAEPAEKQPDSR